MAPAPPQETLNRSPRPGVQLRPLEILTISALAVMAAGLLYQRLLAPGHFYVSIDSVSIHVPFRTFIQRTISLGQLPTWVPNLWMGAPFLANGDAALLYPLQLPFLVFGPATGLGWNLWLHTSLSIVSMYLLARLSLGVRPPAALAAGLAFAFGGYALTHTGLLWAVYEAPWPPLVLLSLERATNGRLGWALLAPPAVALGLLAGNPQELYYCSVWFSLIAAVLWLQAPTTLRGARILGIATVGYVGGALLAAAQLLPQLQLLTLGNRAGSGLNFQEAILAGLPLMSIRDVLLPTGLLHYTGESAAWVGLIGFLLAATGTARLFVGHTRALTACFVVMAVGSYLLALGDATPVFRLVFEWLPGMHQFRIPVRWLYPMSIAVAMLVSQGIDIIIGQAERIHVARGRSWVQVGVPAAAALAICVLALTSWSDPHVLEAWGTRGPFATALYATVAVAFIACVLIHTRWSQAALGMLLVGALGAELYGLARPLEWNYPSSTDIYAERHPIPAYVAAHQAGRVLSLAGNGPNVLVMRDNTPLVVGASSVTGYSTPWPTSLNQPLADVVQTASNDDATFTSRTDLWRLIGVRYVVASSQRQGLAHDPELFARVRDGEWVLYELIGTSGRLATYCGAQMAEDGPALTAAVLKSGFRGDRLYVNGPTDKSLLASRCGSARITGERTDTIHAVTDMPAQGWLLLTDSWYPGWAADIDGEASEVYQADHFFKAVRVPAGRHEVTFRFDPPVFHVGVVISVGAFLLWLAAIPFFASGPLAWQSSHIVKRLIKRAMVVDALYRGGHPTAAIDELTEHADKQPR
jgi:hypothetical protein